MGLLSKLFGSTKAVDAGISALDKIVFTDEEKADDQRMRAKLKIEFLKYYQPYRLSQRFMMLLVTSCFLGVHVFLFLAHIAVMLLFWEQSEVYDHLTRELLNYGEKNIDALGVPFIIMVTFYFGAGEIDLRDWFAGIKKK